MEMRTGSPSQVRRSCPQLHVANLVVIEDSAEKPRTLRQARPGRFEAIALAAGEAGAPTSWTKSRRDGARALVV